MDSGRYGPRAVDAADPVSYETWPTLASVEPQQRSSCSPCSRPRFTWTSVSVLELILMVLTAVYCFFLPQKYLGHIVRAEQKGHINPLSEWVLRMYGSMICVQIALLVAGIGWGDTISRKIIYWGMLTGDILLLAIQASFVHSMSKWNAVNIAIVTTASAFGLFRIITLILNPRWWEWAPKPII